MSKFENDFGTISQNEEISALTLTFKKQSPGPEFITLGQRLLDEFKKLNLNKVLIDASKMGVVSVEGQSYVVQTVIPGMLAHLKGKVLYIAHILPSSDVFAKVAGGNIESKAKKAHEQVVLEPFADLQKATQWLKEK